MLIMKKKNSLTRIKTRAIELYASNSPFKPKIVKQASNNVEQRREAWRVYEIKQRAYDRLSEEDRKILKLRKPTMPKGPKP